MTKARPMARLLISVAGAGTLLIAFPARAQDTAFRISDKDSPPAESSDKSGSDIGGPHKDGPEGGGPPHEDGFELELGAGAFYQPDYKGSNDYKVMPIPWASLNYRRGDRYIELSGPSLRVNIIGGGRFEFGPTLSSDMGRDDDVKNLKVRRLGKIKGAIMAGAFFKTEIDLGEGSGIEIGTEAAFDLGNVNNGKTAKFELGYRRQISDRLMAMTGVSTTWVDRNYMQTYFGVTSVGALASGLPVYNARAGIENVEWSLGMFYRVTDRWNVVGFVNYQRLVSSAAKSPIVRLEGTPNQFGLGMAFSYTF